MSRGHIVRDWLGRREATTPTRLGARMRAALDPIEAEPEDVPSALGAAALVCLRDALAKGSHREAAVDLLAADALLTYGCEAAADAGPGALERFANEYGAARLAALLPDSSRRSSQRRREAGSSAPTGDRSP